MVRTSSGDYSRVEEYLADIEEEIRDEWGEDYDNLDRETQTQVLLEWFFKGIPQYHGSAEDMRDGLAHVRGRGRQPTLDVRVGRITRRGHTYKVIRDARTGRIRQWVKD